MIAFTGFNGFRDLGRGGERRFDRIDSTRIENLGDIIVIFIFFGEGPVELGLRVKVHLEDFVFRFLREFIDGHFTVRGNVPILSTVVALRALSLSALFGSINLHGFDVRGSRGSRALLRSLSRRGRLMRGRRTLVNGRRASRWLVLSSDYLFSCIVEVSGRRGLSTPPLLDPTLFGGDVSLYEESFGFLHDSDKTGQVIVGEGLFVSKNIEKFLVCSSEEILTEGLVVEVGLIGPLVELFDVLMNALVILPGVGDLLSCCLLFVPISKSVDQRILHLFPSVEDCGGFVVSALPVVVVLLVVKGCPITGSASSTVLESSEDLDLFVDELGGLEDKIVVHLS